MTCTRISQQLDDYLERDLPAAELVRLNAHLESCGDCQQAVSRERALRQALQEFPVAGPSEGFYTRALAKAAQSESHNGRTRLWGMSLASAVAAGLAIWLFAGTFLSTPTITPPADIPGVSIALNDSHTVNLVFSSETALADARLVVELPPGIELEGFEGRREIRWRTDLREGRNVLPLQLVANSGLGGELIARLEHERKSKIFRVNVTVS